MIIGTSLCRLGIGFFLVTKQLHHVVDHDNYRLSPSQQLCVEMMKVWAILFLSSFEKQQ